MPPKAPPAEAVIAKNIRLGVWQSAEVVANDPDGLIVRIQSGRYRLVRNAAAMRRAYQSTKRWPFLQHPQVIDCSQPAGAMP